MLLDELPSGTEVVFNDWGMLGAIQKKNLVPVCGRLLVAIERDPRVAGQGAGEREFRTSSLSAEPFSDLLLSRGVVRVELDNVEQGYDFTPRRGMRFSLHYPFVYITVTRKCIMARADAPLPRGKVPVGGDCSYECSGMEIEASVGDCPRRIVLKGNAQFYRNRNDGPGTLHPGVDRLVYSPGLPFPSSPPR